MITLPTSLRTLTVFAAFTLIGLLLGCSDDDACNPYAQERITGTVAGPNGPAAFADVYVQSTYYASVYSVEINTITDHHGSFVAFVPPGTYLLSVEPPSDYSEMWYATPHPVYRRSNAETLQVYPGGDPVIADFLLGGLDIRLGMPPGLDYRTVTCQLRETQESIGVASASAPVEQSGVDLTFNYLAPGIYIALIWVRTLHPYGTSRLWLPCTFDPSGADSIEVSPLESVPWEVDFPSPGQLRGAVHGCWDSDSPSPPLIRAYGSSNQVIADQYIDGRGEFDIPVFAEGQARLVLFMGANGQWIGGDDYDSATAYDVAPGSITVVDINVSCIVCNVTGQAGGEACSAQIVVRNESDRQVAQGQLGCDGELTFANLSPGSYFLSIRPTVSGVWRPQWFDRSALYEEATPVVIEGTEGAVEVTFTLEKGGTIQGHVLDEDGGGAAGLDLEVFAVSTGWDWRGLSQTDLDGSFLAEGLPDDDIRIGVRHAFPDNNKVTWYPGTADEDSAQVITIIDAGEVTGIEWQIQP